MRIFFAGAVWLLVFVGVAIVALVAPAGLAIKHGIHVPREMLRALFIAGPLAGLLAFVVAARARWLPGLRPPRAVLPWGVWQAVWLFLGFVLMQGVGAYVSNVLIGAIVNIPVGFEAGLHHLPLHIRRVHPVIASIMAGYLTSALWCVWFVRRRGPALLKDGSPAGVAWLRAARADYVTAALLAGMITTVMVVMFQRVPPSRAAVETMPIVQTFGQPGWPIAFLILLAVCIAPPTEEFVFRGGIFSALAGRLGPLWAGILTTAVFVAIHAPEKIHYPLGFIDVGMMAGCAAWLRVRAGSIRPGILLHVLYNFGAIIAAGLAH
jgi:membrane protease YdiL (CAAX protease family)